MSAVNPMRHTSSFRPPVGYEHASICSAFKSDPGTAATPSPARTSLPVTLWRLTRALNTACRDAGISWASVSVLVTLSLAPSPMALHELAEAEHITAPTALRTVTNLSDAGLVYRDDDPTDRRRRTIALTESGERYLTSTLGAISALMDDTVKTLPTLHRTSLAHNVPGLRLTHATEGYSGVTPPTYGDAAC